MKGDRVAEHAHRGDTGGVEVWRASFAGLSHGFPRQIIEVDGTAVQAGICIQEGQLQQIVHQRGESRDLLQGQLSRIADLRVAFFVGRMAEVDFQPGAQRRQRRAQFVGGVGDEPALAICGGRDPFQQVVEGLGQAPQLIV